MVLAGEFLERATLIARPVGHGAPLTLEGLYHRGARAPAVVLCAPHPRMGGSMDSPVLSELAWALSQAGHATLRFNFQGVGASQGTRRVEPLAPGDEPRPVATLASEIDDAAAAVELLRASVEHGQVAIAGYSFGAAVALGLALRMPALARVVLVAPPTGLFDFEPLAALARPALVVAGHHDPWVDRRVLAEWAAAHDGAAFEMIPGADHVFSRGLTELGRTVVRWLERGG